MAVTEAAPPPAKGSKSFTIMQVAVQLKLRYTQARDLITAGKLGDSWYEGRHLVVSAAAVAEYQARGAVTPPKHGRVKGGK